MCAREIGAHNDQGRRIQRLGERDKERVPPKDCIPQLPHPVEHRPVCEALTRPVTQVGHRLPSGRTVEAPAKILARMTLSTSTS